MPRNSDETPDWPEDGTEASLSEVVERLELSLETLDPLEEPSDAKD